MIASHLAVGGDPAATAREAAGAVRDVLGTDPTLAAVFASPALVADGAPLLEAVHGVLAPAHLIGCSGEVVVGNRREAEGEHAVVVWAAHLPGARVVPVRALAYRRADGEMEITGWPELPGDPAAEPGVPGPDDVIIALADPFSFPADLLLERLGDAPWRPPVVGGLASGGTRRGEHRLFLDGEWYVDGLVGVAVGGVEVATAVSQGCAPVGPEMVVTDAGDGGVVYELAGRPAVARLEEVIEGLDPPVRRLAATGLLAGLVIDENRPEYRRGDYLVRGILGGDTDTGAILVGERVRTGQTLRLHVRDARSAGDDLREALREVRSRMVNEPAGALLFTCNGRGASMFGEADHDANVLGDELHEAPVAGLFCNGEIGPVGGRTFLHGFTATMAVFGSRTPRG
jgi:small ligand-binding sensory domain FIST